MPSLTRPSNNRLPVAGGASLGISMFAGMMLALVGGFHFLRGLAAVMGPNDNLWGDTDYSYSLNTTSWGWVHLVLGVVAVVVGIGIMVGKTWAFVLGLLVAGLSALGNFLSLPQEPFWSVIMVAFDVLVIWALTTEMREPS